VEFFVYHRDRPDSAGLRDQMLDQHWSYMDGFQAELIARGPTLTPDGEYATGSVHIIDLPSPADARAFAFDEPTYQAGVYRDVLLRRWRNRLGRTMWDYPGGRVESDGYLVIGLGGLGGGPLPAIERLIAYGPLLSDSGDTHLGVAALLQAPDPAAARAVLPADDYAGIEVHHWASGGRPT
jgi:uncharacterized protein YciI